MSKRCLQSHHHCIPSHSVQFMLLAYMSINRRIGYGNVVFMHKRAPESFGKEGSPSICSMKRTEGESECHKHTLLWDVKQWNWQKQRAGDGIVDLEVSWWSWKCEDRAQRVWRNAFWIRNKLFCSLQGPAEHGDNDRYQHNAVHFKITDKIQIFSLQ
jgi:hypothetical protein